MIIPGPTGEELTVYATESGGYVDLNFRAPDFPAWETFKHEMFCIDHVTDTGHVFRTGPGVNVFEIGARLISPAVFDNDSNVVTPANFDTRHHSILRIDPRLYSTDANGSGALNALLWYFHLSGEVGADCFTWSGVDLLNPDTLNEHWTRWL